MLPLLGIPLALVVGESVWSGLSLLTRSGNAAEVVTMSNKFNALLNKADMDRAERLGLLPSSPVFLFTFFDEPWLVTEEEGAALWLIQRECQRTEGVLPPKLMAQYERLRELNTRRMADDDLRAALLKE